MGDVHDRNEASESERLAAPRWLTRAGTTATGHLRSISTKAETAIHEQIDRVLSLVRPTPPIEQGWERGPEGEDEREVEDDRDDPELLRALDGQPIDQFPGLDEILATYEPPPPPDTNTLSAQRRVEVLEQARRAGLVRQGAARSTLSLLGFVRMLPSLRAIRRRYRR